MMITACQGDQGGFPWPQHFALDSFLISAAGYSIVEPQPAMSSAPISSANLPSTCPSTRDLTGHHQPAQLSKPSSAVALWFLSCCQSTHSVTAHPAFSSRNSTVGTGGPPVSALPSIHPPILPSSFMHPSFLEHRTAHSTHLFKHLWSPRRFAHHCTTSFVSSSPPPSSLSIYVGAGALVHSSRGRQLSNPLTHPTTLQRRTKLSEVFVSSPPAQAKRLWLSIAQTSQSKQELKSLQGTGSLHVHGTEQLQRRSVLLGVSDDSAHLFWSLGGLFLCTVRT